MKSKWIYTLFLLSFFSKLAFANESRSIRTEKVEVFEGVLQVVQMENRTHVLLVVSETEVYKLHIYFHLRGVTLMNIGKRVEVRGVRVKEDEGKKFPTLKVRNLVRKNN